MSVEGDEATFGGENENSNSILNSPGVNIMNINEGSSSRTGKKGVRFGDSKCF